MDSEACLTPVSSSSAPPRGRRILQISLRTFFILFTAGCVWLGLITKRARDQRAAVNRILELGGSVSFDYEFDKSGKRIKDAQPPGWRWLRQSIGDEYFRDVHRVMLDRTAVTDDDLRLIGKLRATKTLSLNFTQIGDSGLAHLRHLRKLEYLGLSETRITDDGLRHIEDLKQLDSLILEGTTGVSDVGIDSIMKLKQLQILNLHSTRVSSDGAKQLFQLPTLHLLYLSDTEVDDTLVESIHSQSSVAELSLWGTVVSGMGLMRLREALPSCSIDAEFVDLSDDPPFNDSPKFSTYWSRLVDRLTALNNERRLKLIDFSGSQFTDRYLPDLYTLNNVEVIDLRDTNVTDPGVQALRKALDKCCIER